MAKYLNTKVKVEVNGVDLSNHAFAVDTPQEKDRVEVSGFSATGAREFLPGQRDDTITIRFLQDFASNKVHATLQPLFNDGTTFLLWVTPDSSAAVSATNPSYSGSVLVSEVPTIDGSVGDLAQISVTWNGAGTLTRATA